MREFVIEFALIIIAFASLSCSWQQECGGEPFDLVWSGAYENEDGSRLTIDEESELVWLERDDDIRGNVRISWRLLPERR